MQKKLKSVDAKKERCHRKGNSKKKWEPPRVEFTEKIQTLAYTCSGGPAPTSGTTCPPP
jgi:hypothetical protein